MLPLPHPVAGVLLDQSQARDTLAVVFDLCEFQASRVANGHLFVKQTLFSTL